MFAYPQDYVNKVYDGYLAHALDFYAPRGKVGAFQQDRGRLMPGELFCRVGDILFQLLGVSLLALVYHVSKM